MSDSAKKRERERGTAITTKANEKKKKKKTTEKLKEREEQTSSCETRKGRKKGEQVQEQAKLE